MATENGILDLAYPAAEDLTNDKYRIVVLSDGKVRRPDSAAEVALGILQNAPEKGEAASVRLIGVSKIVLGGAVAENDWVKIEYVDAADSGKGIAAQSALDLAVGRSLTAGSENYLGEILLSGAVHQVNVAS